MYIKKLLEYEDLRDEIKKRMDQRTHISYFVIAMTSGALGLYMSLREPLILVFAPSILIYWLLIIDSSYTHYREIIQYIREKIEGMKLPMLIEKASDEDGWIYWKHIILKTEKDDILHDLRFMSLSVGLSIFYVV